MVTFRCPCCGEKLEMDSSIKKKARSYDLELSARIKPLIDNKYGRAVGKAKIIKAIFEPRVS